MITFCLFVLTKNDILSILARFLQVYRLHFALKALVSRAKCQTRLITLFLQPTISKKYSPFPCIYEKKSLYLQSKMIFYSKTTIDYEEI